MNRRQVGAQYEKLAGQHLEQQGYEILAYNYRCRFGEIDIVAKEGGYLVFAEVKYRKNSRVGNPLEAVDKRKQQQISRTAAYYLLRYGYREDMPCRFDVVAVSGEEISVIKNAFFYCGF